MNVGKGVNTGFTNTIVGEAFTRASEGPEDKPSRSRYIPAIAFRIVRWVLDPYRDCEVPQSEIWITVRVAPRMHGSTTVVTLNTLKTLFS